MTDILKIAYREHAQCLETLKASKVFTALKAWEKVIADNGGVVPSVASRQEPALDKRAPARNHKQVSRGAPGKKATVRALAAECIGQHNGHAHRTVIHEYLAKKNVHLTPKRLTAYLSDWQEFKPDREKGWSMKKSKAA